LKLLRTRAVSVRDSFTEEEHIMIQKVFKNILRLPIGPIIYLLELEFHGKPTSRRSVQTTGVAGASREESFLQKLIYIM
jgi:hypothetical protein